MSKAVNSSVCLTGARSGSRPDRGGGVLGGDDTILLMKSRVLVVDDDPALSEMLSIVLPGGIGGNDSAGFDVSKRTRDHWRGSCSAGVGVESLEQPPTNDDPSPPLGSV